MPKSSSPKRPPARDAFRLLLPSDSPVPEDQPSIELGGHRWIVTESADIPRGEDAPEYTCLSYAWGSGRTTHPFDNRETMSDRTLAAMEVAIRVQRPAVLWVDAFCVPFDEPARSTCLSQMGAIYGQATRVVVVLSAPCLPMLEQIRNEVRVDAEALLTFERDDWVSRVWTYQELVNNNKIRFAVEGGSDAWADAEEVFNKVAHAISDYKKAQRYDSFTFRSLHPRLDGLEDLVLDWKLFGYLERSAYQVMSGMDQRDAAQREDYLYAMIGAISASEAEAPALPLVHPAEYFIQICEAKGDYSFIYSTASRSTAPGKGWRPSASDRLHPVFPWSSYGDGQSGRVYPTHIELNGMWRAMPGSITAPASNFVAKWLERSNAGSSKRDVPAHILRLLQLAGFSGCGEHLETEHGYMFPHSPLTEGDGLFPAVATGIRMPHGSPGLLLRANRSKVHECHGVGMFVGQVPESGETVRVG